MYAFDLGNVLVEFSHENFQENLGRFKQLYPYLMDMIYHNQYNCGLITFADICRHIFDRLNQIYLSKDIDFIVNAWNNAIIPNTEMINFVADLAKNQYDKNGQKQVAILSNIGKEHADHILKICPQLNSEYIIHHFSYQVGAIKPTKLFFQSFLIERNSFRGCLFLDDKIENVEMAYKCGLNAKLFSLEDFKQLNSDKKNMILEKINEKKI